MEFCTEFALFTQAVSKLRSFFMNLRSRFFFRGGVVCTLAIDEVCTSDHVITLRTCPVGI